VLKPKTAKGIGWKAVPIPKYYLFLQLTNSSPASKSKNVATSNNLLIEGWAVFVHQLETVSGAIFNASAKSLLVTPFSARAAFILL
jgi:hypothetical protein